jgi:TP901 family phage tail tape measure protein
LSDTDYTLGMNVSGYLNSGRQATAVTQQLQDAVASLTQGSVVASAAMNRLIPLSAFAGMGKFAAAAAGAQQEINGLKATTQAAGGDIGKLVTVSDGLSKKFALGQSGARALTSEIQSLGVTGAGSEKRVGALGAEFVRLGAATRTSAAAVGSGVANLARAFGDQNLNPKNISGISDSLVTLQARFGGSASGILGFSQAIAPFARQAGLSEKATLGIAGAFSKLGEDSGQAATAVNKVLADLTRSARDGGPQMLKYASIVGMTTKEFRELFKSDPAKALSQVTAALGTSGTRGQRDLESLGLDGLRTQRALSTLSQNGGLEQAINASVNAPEGAADKAGDTAMSGFNEQMGKLSSTAEQLAERLGAPILGPLTAFASGLTKIIDIVDNIAGSGVGKVALEAGVATAGVRFAGGLAAKGAGATLIGKAALNSGSMKALRSGMLGGKLDMTDEELQATLETRMADLPDGPRSTRARMKTERQLKDVVYTRALSDESDDTLPYGAGAHRKLNGFGRGLRGGQFPDPGLTSTGTATPPDENGNFPGGVAPTGPATAPSSQGLFQRARNWGGLLAGGYVNQTHTMMANIANADTPQDVAAMPKNPLRSGLMSDIKTNVGAAKASDDGPVDKLKGMASALADSFKKTDTAMQDVATHGTAASRGLKDVGAAGGGMLKSLAGAAGTGMKLGGGLAAEALGGPMALPTLGIAAAGFLWNRHESSVAAKKEEDESWRQGGISASADVFNTELGRAAQSTKTMADEMVAATKKLADLRIPSSMSDATTVTDQDVADAKHVKGKRSYNGKNNEVAAQIDALTIDKMDPQYMQAIKLDMLHDGRSRSDVENVLGRVNTGAGPMTGQDTNAILAQVSNRATDKHGVGSGGKKSLQLINENIAQTYESDKEAYGEDYAEAQRAKAMNAAMTNLAQRTKGKGGVGGEYEVAGILQRQFQSQLDDSGDGTKIGGNLDRILQGGKATSSQLLPVANVTKPEVSPGTNFKLITEGDNKVDPEDFIARVFNNRTGGLTHDAVAGLDPGSGKSINETIQALLKGAKAAGVSLLDFATSSRKAAENLPTGQEQDILRLASQRAEGIAMATAPTQGAAIGMSLTSNLAAATTVSDDPNDTTQQDAAKAAKSSLDQYASIMGQRLQAQQNYQIQSVRSADDFQRQIQRSEDDFQRGRQRSQRDFNLSIRRQNEDAAKAMYDPYHRAGVEALWDTDSLLENMGEQQKRLDDQVANLARARKMGLNTQTIQTLGLADSSHAQELQELVDTGNAGSAARLNNATARRIAAAGELNQDAGNPNAARARQDFAQAQKDQNEDFARNNQRSRDDFNRGQARMLDDLHRSQLAMTQDFGKLQDAMNRLSHGQAVNFQTLMSDTLDDVQTQVATKGLSITQAYQQVIAALNGDTTTTTPSAKKPTGTPGAGGQGHMQDPGEGGPTSAMDYVSPVNGPVTSGFGKRKAPKAGASTNHPGIDYGVPIGTAVRAAFDGIIKDERKAGGYGNLLVIDHGGGRETRYGHLSGYTKPEGAHVKAGEVVARSGNTGNSTGPHLHFETRQNGVAMDPRIEVPLWSRTSPGVPTGDLFAHMAVDPEDGTTATHINRLMEIAYNVAVDKLKASRSGRGAGNNGSIPGVSGTVGNAPVDIKGNVALGKKMAAAYGWGAGAEWNNLYALWQQESGWNSGPSSQNSIGSYGIPQAVPGSKMGQGPHGHADWRTNPASQIDWGLDYIKSRYGDPIGAEAHKRATDSRLGSTAKYAQPGGWYGNGSIFQSPKVIGVGERGPEAVIPLNNQGSEMLAKAFGRYMSQGQAKVVGTAQARTHVNYDQSQHITDNRQTIEHVELQADGPRELMMKLDEIRRRDNLTRTPTRRGG